MLKKVNNDILIKDENDRLLRFSCNDDLGLYYEVINNNKIIGEKFVIQRNFKYFFIIKDFDRNINLICQDEVGNIILYILIDNKWKYKTLLYIKNNYITPINTKGFFYSNELMLLLNLDSDSENIYSRNRYNDFNIIYSESEEVHIEYNVLEGNNYASLIINSNFFDIYKLAIKSFNKNKGLWGNNQVVYISKEDYLDKSYCLINNKIHFLILLNNKNKKQIIYKNINIDKNEELQKETIIFEHKDISSCLISEINNVLFAVWIVNDKIVASYSTNYGEDFSKPKVYKVFDDEVIQKINFLENDKAIETYFYETDGNMNLFLNKILSL